MPALISGVFTLRNIAIDIVILAGIYFVPALAHVAPFQLYMLDPMRVFMLAGYLFVDNDKQKETSPKGITYGTAVHFHGDAWTIMKDPEDAIVFCDRLNRGEIK